MQIEDRSVRRSPQSALDPRHIPFGKQFAPNMFLCDYQDGRWQNARIEPLHAFSIHPAALVLHYAQSIFEGMKAFRQPDGSVALFRPEQNARRFQRSAERMCMPTVDEELFLSAVSELTRVEEEYVVAEPGSLYLRPVLMGTEASIGVRASSDYLFYVLALPSGSYFPEARHGLGSVSVVLAESVVRAGRGGTGAVKTAANYAVTLKTIADARQHGCSQVLFFDSTPEQRVEEMGGMNIMFIENETLITPPLNETLLPGVVRASILQLAADLGMATREEAFPIQDLLAKLEAGAIQEVFACGTAAVITGISSLRTEHGKVFELPAPGPITSKLYESLTAVLYGHKSDQHGWLRQVVPAHSLA